MELCCLYGNSNLNTHVETETLQLQVEKNNNNDRKQFRTTRRQTARQLYITCAHTHACMHTHTRTHAHTCTHTHKHTHTHACRVFIRRKKKEWQTKVFCDPLSLFQPLAFSRDLTLCWTLCWMAQQSSWEVRDCWNKPAVFYLPGGRLHFALGKEERKALLFSLDVNWSLNCSWY